jgi:DNA-binding response OmpR family regulator
LLGRVSNCSAKDSVTLPKALKYVKKALPDLILLDMDISDMDGLEVCQRLQQYEKCHNIPIIFVSDLPNTDKKRKGFAAGADDFISKPILIEEVLARINTHITLSRLRRKQEEQVVERTAEKRLLNAYNEIEHLKQKLHQENLYPKRIKVLHNHDRIVGKGYHGPHFRRNRDRQRTACQCNS